MALYVAVCIHVAWRYSLFLLLTLTVASSSEDRNKRTRPHKQLLNLMASLDRLVVPHFLFHGVASLQATPFIRRPTLQLFAFL